MFKQTSKVEFHLPAWLSEFANGKPVIQDMNDRMAFVIEASWRNVKENTGGPFAAAIFEKDSGKLVSLGVNLVPTERLSILHAEMVAITLAQRKLGVYDLDASGLPLHELVTSTEPCAMCFGAIPWSGVRRVVTAARGVDARSIGFDEGPKPGNWRAALEERGIDVVCDVQRKEAMDVLSEYARLGGHIYNSRESG